MQPTVNTADDDALQHVRTLRGRFAGRVTEAVSIEAMDPGFVPPPKTGLSRDRTLAVLAESKPLLAAQFGVVELALFGPTARGTARADSEVDILVVFDGPASSQRYFGVQFLLEDLLGRSVDLVTDKTLRAELRPFIEAEAIRV